MKTENVVIPYDYRYEMRKDIMRALQNDYESRDFDELFDALFVNDSVTGNASGSYTFCTYTAELYLAGNWDLLRDALEEFGCSSVDILEKGAEWCDVTIRCYLLGEILKECLDDLEKEEGAAS